MTHTPALPVREVRCRFCRAPAALDRAPFTGLSGSGKTNRLHREWLGKYCRISCMGLCLALEQSKPVVTPIEKSSEGKRICQKNRSDLLESRWRTRFRFEKFGFSYGRVRASSRKSRFQGIGDRGERKHPKGQTAGAGSGAVIGGMLGWLLSASSTRHPD